MRARAVTETPDPMAVNRHCFFDLDTRRNRGKDFLGSEQLSEFRAQLTIQARQDLVNPGARGVA